MIRYVIEFEIFLLHLNNSTKYKYEKIFFQKLVNEKKLNKIGARSH